MSVDRGRLEGLADGQSDAIDPTETSVGREILVPSQLGLGDDALTRFREPAQSAVNFHSLTQQ
jgi:hypothetical protein